MVIESKLDPIGAVTPTCESCGCTAPDISIQEYQEKKTYWDNWLCDVCRPRNEYAVKKIGELENAK